MTTMSLKLTKKLIFSGGSYKITLPILWIRNFKLKKRSELELTLADNGELVIKPK
jgi:phosphate uptake regulator